MEKAYSIGCWCILLIVLSFLLNFQSCNPTEPNNNPPDTNRQYVKIDGFTSATRKLTVDSIIVFHDHAEVYWEEYYDGKDPQIVAYRIEWGKTEGTYTDTLNLKPFEPKTDIITTIPNLEPNTTYYCQFYRDWHGTIKKTPFSFTTPSKPEQE